MNVCQRFKNLKFLEKKPLNKPQCRYGLTVCKCQIQSQTIKYRYKLKSNQKDFFSQKCLYEPPQGVYQVSSLYHK